MSNTSEVSPYVSTSTNVTVAQSRARASAAAFARWLAAETAAEKAAVDRAREQRRRERLEQTVPQPIRSVELHLREPESLIRSAEALGYRPEPLAVAGRPLREQPQILLTSARGERIALERTASGRLALHTAGDVRRIESLMAQHTSDQVTDYFGRQGMVVERSVRRNGELEMLVRERQQGQSGGVAEIRAHVGGDGRLSLDVDKIQGSRCDKLVSEIAESIGGAVTRTDRKSAYYQLPGEPRSTIKVG